MTTTSTFQGMEADSKPSSRVLNPPGGGSSNIFGVEPTPAAPRQQQAPGNKSSNIFGAPASQEAPAPAKSRNQRSAFNPITGEPLYPQQPPAKSQKPPEQSDADGASAGHGAHQSASTESTDSTLSGAASVTGASVTGTEHPSTRISQPPGGRSTKLW